MPPITPWRRFLLHTTQGLAVLRLLSPTFLQLVAAIMPLGAYILSDQGADVLSALGEGVYGGAPDNHWRVTWFVVINFFAGIVIWWSARVTLEFRLIPPSLPWGIWRKVRPAARLWWPRLLGAVAALNIGIAFLVDAQEYGLRPPASDSGATSVQSPVNEPAGSHGLDKTTEPVQKQLPLVVPPNIQKYRMGLIVLGYTHCALSALLMAIFIGRRSWLRGKQSPEPGPRYRYVKDVLAQSPADFYFTLGLVVFSLAVLFSLWVSPIWWGQHIGTGAILSLAAISGVTWGTIVLNGQARTGLPMVVLLIGWAAWCSYVMDNHDIRQSHDDHSQPVRLDNDRFHTVEETVIERYSEKTPASNDGDAQPGIEPVFVVATEGGGIRAAYWTALVLGHLQEETVPSANNSSDSSESPRDFASRLFAISGVSGGSVGAAVFTALLADGKKNPAALSSEILGKDHLSPLIGTLLFPDLLQRFWFKALPGTDRATSIEESWERAYQSVAQTDRLKAPFRSLWAEKSKRLPHLFLNSTMVDDGQRLIFSDLAISAGPPGGEFMAAWDARNFVYLTENGQNVAVDVPLSTAAHASARFTYTNPAGRLSTKNRFVDGGYFEDSGATTALEVVEAIERVQQARDAAWQKLADQAAENHAALPHRNPRLVPVVINISNSPTVLAAGAQAGADGSAPEASKSREQKEQEPFHFASELLSPPRALMQTRGARGTFARREICEHQRRQWFQLTADKQLSWPKEFTELFRLNDPDKAKHGIPTFIEFGLVKQGIPLPLGWSLSKGAKDDMEAQFYISRQEGTQSNPSSEEAVKLWLQLAR